MTDAPALIALECCPACDGSAPSPLFLCGTDANDERRCDVTEMVCPLCLGTGMLPVGRASWPTLGARLRRVRERNKLPWFQDADGRYWWTLQDVPLAPIPLAFAAQTWRVPLRLAERIEAGEADPRTVARHVRPVQRRVLAGLR